MYAFTKIIKVSSVGLGGKRVYLAHEKGKWGPEPPAGNFQKHKLKRKKGDIILELDGSMLRIGEEFKIVVPVTDEVEARKIFAKRVAAGTHIGERFDFDANYNVLWLLAKSHPVIRPGAWNQNNVFC